MSASVRSVQRVVTARTVAVLFVAIYFAMNVGLAAYSVSQGFPFNPDWALWKALPSALESGSPYRAEAPVPFVWSPLMAWLMAAVVIHVGFWPWAVLHVAALALLRDPLMIGLTLASWGFWLDLGGGNTFTFVFVAACLALHGNRAAVIASFVLFLLMPRPIQLPLMLWLLWTAPWSRIPFVALAAVHTAAVLATGLGSEWLHSMLAYGPGNHPYDIGPGRWIGAWWLVVGIPIAAWLWVRGFVGWSGLAVSPYLVPQYLLMPLIDLRRGRKRTVDQAKS